MTLREKRTVLVFGSTLLALACVAVVAGGVLLPVRVEADPPANMPELASGGSTDPNDAPADPNRMSRVFADLQRLARMDLRRPLVKKDVPRRTSTKTPPKPRLQLRLLGTAEEPGRSLAYFQERDGSTVWLAEGERLKTPAGEVVVKTITSERVTITLGEQTIEQKVPVRSWQGETP